MFLLSDVGAWPLMLYLFGINFLKQLQKNDQNDYIIIATWNWSIYLSINNCAMSVFISISGQNLISILINLRSMIIIHSNIMNNEVLYYYKTTSLIWISTWHDLQFRDSLEQMNHFNNCTTMFGTAITLMADWITLIMCEWWIVYNIKKGRKKGGREQIKAFSHYISDTSNTSEKEKNSWLSAIHWH